MYDNANIKSARDKKNTKFRRVDGLFYYFGYIHMRKISIWCNSEARQTNGVYGCEANGFSGTVTQKCRPLITCRV